jgi:SAM-dependent methyltransferase
MGDNVVLDQKKIFQKLLNETKDIKERQFYEYMLDTFDFGKYEEIQAKYLPLKSESGALGSAKYLRLAHYMKLRYKYVIDLKLDSIQPLNILDIGCGPGHFGYICKYFGHKVIGLDLPDTTVYTDIIELLGMERICFAIRPDVPLIETRKFDYVTAFHALFFRVNNYGERKKLFSLDNWKFFFTDLIKNHMADHGKIYLRLNNIREIEGLHFHDTEFINYIENNGGKVKGNHIIIEDISQSSFMC